MALDITAGVKAILGITASTYDTQIAALIPVLQAALERMTGAHFDQAAYVEYFDGDDQDRIVVSHPPIASTPAPIVYDDLDRTFPADSVVSSGLLFVDYRAGIIRIDTNLLTGWSSYGGIGLFRKGNGNVKVSYTGNAWAATDLDGPQYVLAEMVQYALNRISTAGKTSETIGSYSWSAPQIDSAHLSIASRDVIAAWKQMGNFR